MASSLHTAISKLVLAAQLVGVSPDDMIELLNAGVSVEGLLQLVAHCPQAPSNVRMGTHSKVVSQWLT